MIKAQVETVILSLPPGSLLLNLRGTAQPVARLACQHSSPARHASDLHAPRTPNFAQATPAYPLTSILGACTSPSPKISLRPVLGADSAAETPIALAADVGSL